MSKAISKNPILKLQKFNEKLKVKKEQVESELSSILDIEELCKFITKKIDNSKIPAYKNIYIRHRNKAMVVLWTSGKTLAEIGQATNLTRERSRQILNKNLEGNIRQKGGQTVRKITKENQTQSQMDAFLETAFYRIKNESLDLSELLKLDGFDAITSRLIKNQFKKKHPLIGSPTYNKKSLTYLGLNFQEFLKLQEDIIKSGHSPQKMIKTFQMKKAQTISLRKMDFSLSLIQWWDLVKPFLNSDFSLNRKDEKIGYVQGNVFVSNARNILFGLDDFTKQTQKEATFDKARKIMILKAKQKTSDYDIHREKIVEMLFQGYSVNSISDTLNIPPTSLRDLMKKTSFSEVTKEFSGLSMTHEERKEEFIKVSKSLGLLKK